MTILFIGAFLILQKERHWWRITLYSIIFGLGIAGFFSQMLPYPMPMLFLLTDY